MGIELKHDASKLTCVTASRLARNFGHWQDVALREPVYVVHRGRPRLALTSVEFLSDLVARHAADIDWPRGRQALIDAFDPPVAMFDARRRLVASNPAMRAFLDLASDRQGTPLDGPASNPVTNALAAIVDRVRATGLVERIELGAAAEDHPVEALAVRIGDEVLLALTDLTPRVERDRFAALLGAWDVAIDALDHCAAARVNLRGYLVEMTDSLARLAGTAAHQPARVRLVSLFDTESRARIGDALDRVLGGGVAEAVEAILLVGGAERRPVTLSIAPVAPRIAVEEALILITGAPGSAHGRPG